MARSRLPTRASISRPGTTEFQQATISSWSYGRATPYRQRMLARPVGSRMAVHLIVAAYVQEDGNVSVPLEHDSRVVSEGKRPAAHEWTAELVSFQTWVVRIVLEQPDCPR